TVTTTKRPAPTCENVAHVSGQSTQRSTPSRTSRTSASSPERSLPRVERNSLRRRAVEGNPRSSSSPHRAPSRIGSASDSRQRPLARPRGTKPTRQPSERATSAASFATSVLLPESAGPYTRARRIPESRSASRASKGLAAGCQRERLAQVSKKRAARVRGSTREQIGRASCRERVEISEVAEAGKRTKQTKQIAAYGIPGK